VRDEVLSLCSEIMYQYVKESTKFDDGARTFGFERVADLFDEECVALAEFGVPVTESISFFNRALKDDVVYYRKAYTKPTKFDDTCVILADNKYTVIEKIIRIPGCNELLMFVRPIRIAEEEYIVLHILTCSSDMFGQVKVVKFADVFRKCAMISVKVGTRQKNVVIVLPNVFEKD